MALRYFLACLIVLACLDSGEALTYGVLGQSVLLVPDSPGHPDDILWTHDGNKVVAFNGKEEHVNSRYQNRVTLDWVSAELHITDLGHEDSGEYELEILVNKQKHRFQDNLAVIGKVSKPSVSCDMYNSSSDKLRAWATLTCSAEPTQPQSLMKYEWESGGSVQPGPELAVLLEDEQDDQTFTCRVSNPLTFETTTFDAKTCFPDDKSSSVSLAVTLILIFITLLLVVLGVGLCKLKNKACFAKRSRDDVENRFPPGATEEGDEGELKPFIDASTLPSHQRLRPLARDGRDEESEKEENQIEEEKSPAVNDLSSPPPAAKDPSSPTQLFTPNSPDKGTEDTAGEYEDNANSDHVHGETESPSPHSERSTESVSESEKEKNEIEEEKSPAANDLSSSPSAVNDLSSSPAANGLSSPTQLFTPNSPDKGTEDTAGEYEDNANSDQVHGETESPSPDSERSTESVSESENEENGIEEEKSPAASDPSSPSAVNDLSSPTQLLTQNSPDKGTEDTAGEYEDTDNSDHVHGEMESPSPHSERSNESVSESEKEENEIEKENSPAVNNLSSPPNDLSSSSPAENDLSSPTQLFTPNSPDKGTEDTAGEYEDTANSDHVHGEMESPSPDSERSNEPDESGEEEQLPTSPEQNNSETASREQDTKLLQQETHRKEDDQPEMDKIDSGDKHESDGEETDENLYVDTSQTPSPENTENTQTNVIPDPDHKVEDGSRHESECEGQVDSSSEEEECDEGKTDERTKDGRDPKEEQPDKNESEDKEKQ